MFNGINTKFLRGLSASLHEGARVVAGHCIFMSAKKASSGRPHGHNALGGCCDRRTCGVAQAARFDVSMGAELVNTAKSGRFATSSYILAVELIALLTVVW